MPSRRSPRRRRPPASTRRSSLAAAAFAGLLAVFAAGCPPTQPPAPPPPPPPFAALPAADRPFLVSPLTGYPHAVDAGRRVRLEEAYAALGRGDATPAETAAAELLAADPALHPARVLAAQAEFLRGDPSAALETVRPAATELPSYTAAQLLRGRAAEAAGRAVEAFEAYRAAAPTSQAAAARAAEVAPRAEEIVFRRVEDALARGRTAAAETAVETLREWAPEGDTTLRAERALAVARDDSRAELAAVTRLAERFPEDRELAGRRADLELAVGDAGVGLALYERLAAEHPGDAELAARVEAAKFRWRFLQLPPAVTEPASRPEISRGGFATLLYWLAPSVRYGRGSTGRIASDILDHPRREEIARVVNLGLMDVETAVHRFAPERPVSRGEALAALLRLLGGAAGGEPRPCAGEVPLNRRPSLDFVCSTSASCGLIPSGGDCLAQAPLSGAEALELIRRALLRLGS